MPLLAQHLKHGQTCQLHHVLTATTEKHPNMVRTHSGKKMATNRMQICP